MAAPRKDPPAADEAAPQEAKAPDPAALAAEVERLRADLDAAREGERQRRAEFDQQVASFREQLDALRIEHREALEAQRRDFSDAWRRRELEIEAQRPAPPPPSRPKRRVFAFSCVVAKNGGRQAVAPGDEVDPNMDLTGLPPGAVVEE